MNEGKFKEFFQKKIGKIVMTIAVLLLVGVVFGTSWWIISSSHAKSYQPQVESQEEAENEVENEAEEKSTELLEKEYLVTTFNALDKLTDETEVFSVLVTELLEDNSVVYSQDWSDKALTVIVNFGYHSSTLEGVEAPEEFKLLDEHVKVVSSYMNRVVDGYPRAIEDVKNGSTDKVVELIEGLIRGLEVKNEAYELILEALADRQYEV